jgi:hypothetical protein
MSEQLIAWIRFGRRAQIGQQEFTQCIRRIRRPELDSHTYRMECMKHIPMQIQSIYCFLLGSPVPYSVSPHTDKNRTNGPIITKIFANETIHWTRLGCYFPNREFNDYTLKTFKWNYTMCKGRRRRR